MDIHIDLFSATQGAGWDINTPSSLIDAIKKLEHLKPSITEIYLFDFDKEEDGYADGIDDVLLYLNGVLNTYIPEEA